MSFQDVASELIHQIYNSLHTVSDVINLSLTCRRFNSLLRNAHKLTTLFAAADREFGPVEDIIMLVTHSHNLPAHVKRSPPLSYALLRQVITVGMVGKRFEQIYPSSRWNTDFINRRSLSDDETFRLRRAMYRYWLYSDAFHNRLYPRTHRMLRSFVEERSQLLRNWTNQELIELEDVRSIFADILTFQLCPTDGMVHARLGKDTVYVNWQHRLETKSRPVRFLDKSTDLFFSAHFGSAETSLSTHQARMIDMDGWGDEISQYYTIQSMLKLNPAQIIWLHDHATYKWEVEAFVQQLGSDWFWDNGQTLSDTWSLVLHARGVEVESTRVAILENHMGITAREADCV